MYTTKTLYNKRFSAADIQVEILLHAEWMAPPAYNERVAEEWREKERLAKEDGVRIWDGIYYRVTNVSEVKETGKLKFRLGTIPYRYIATVASLRTSFELHNLEPLCPLATAAIIRTADGFYLFGRRSRNGAVDLIGGGVQRDELEIMSGADLGSNLLKEIVEETGIEHSHIQSVEGIGIVQSLTSNIIIVSLVQLKLSQREAHEVFQRRLEDEMSELIFVPENEIKSFLKSMTSYRPLIADLM